MITLIQCLLSINNNFTTISKIPASGLKIVQDGYVQMTIYLSFLSGDHFILLFFLTTQLEDSTCAFATGVKD